MRAAMHKLGTARTETVIVGTHPLALAPVAAVVAPNFAGFDGAGDRMDTDILSGIQSEISTCLVLSGVTAVKDLKASKCFSFTSPTRSDCLSLELTLPRCVSPVFPVSAGLRGANHRAHSRGRQGVQALNLSFSLFLWLAFAFPCAFSSCILRPEPLSG
jgi:hypothetical protein